MRTYCLKRLRNTGLQLGNIFRFKDIALKVPGQPAIKHGLGMTLNVEFGDSANLTRESLCIDISSAGCLFMAKALAPVGGLAEATFEQPEPEFAAKSRKHVAAKTAVKSFGLS